MALFERHLFLGFPVDSDYQAGLSFANPQLLSLYIQKNGEYLQEYLYAEVRYLGRTISSPAQLCELELLESHIFSLLTRLVPNYSYLSSKLWLLPLIQEELISGRL